MTDRKQYP